LNFRDVGGNLGRGAPDQEGTGSVSVVSIAWRNKFFIAKAAFLSALLASIVLLNMTPIYKARSQVRLGAGLGDVIDIKNTATDATASQAFVLSEVAVIEAAPLLRAVVEELELYEIPEFNPKLREVGVVEGAIKGARRLVNRLTRPGGGGGGGAVKDPSQDAVAAVRGRMEVRPLGTSYVIEIRVKSSSPSLAAKIANSIAEHYVDRQVERKIAASERATQFLAERAEILRQDLLLAEQRVEDYKTAAAEEGESSAEVLRQLVSEISLQLVNARGELVAAESRHKEMLRLLENRSYLAASQIAVSPLLDDLRRRYANISTEIENFEERYGADYSGTTRLRDMRGEVERSLRAEIEKITDGAEATADVIQARVDALTTDLAEAELDFASQSQQTVSQRELEREAEAVRAVYGQFLIRLKEARERGGFQVADAEIVSLAAAPSSPSEPRKVMLALIAAFGGAGLALGFSVVGHFRRSTYISEDEIRASLDLPVYGNIPTVPDDPTTKDVLKWMRSRPHSALAEAVRWFRVAIHAQPTGRPRVIMLTSALPGEGKTTLSVLLAQASADAGDKTLLIDADVRRTSASRAFGIRKPGIYSLTEFGFHLHSIEWPKSSADQFSTGNIFENLLRVSRKKYETIIVDAPPALSIIDTAVFGRQADVTILTCHWNQTPRGSVEKTLRHLRSLDVNVVGVALTLVDLERQAEENFQGASYALNRTMTYYSDEVEKP